MFLFKHIEYSEITDNEEIYITVCFYLNVVKRQKLSYIKKIYITVCFYLNIQVLMLIVNILAFTLQYVSI